MSQVTEGTVSVTNGSATVTGTDVSWATVPATAVFYIDGDTRSYELIAPPSGNTLTLSTPYQGVTNAASSYSLSTDFTPFLGLARIGNQDIGTRPLLRQIADAIDAWAAGGGGGGGGGGGAVTRVFGRTGAILAQAGDYTAALITDSATKVIMLATERSKLAGIADGAQVNRLVASQAQAQAGTDNSTDMTPLRTAQAIAALGGGAGGSAEAVAGGTFVPSSITFTNAKTTYSQYNQGGAVTFTLNLAGSTFHEGEIAVYFNSNGASLTWSATLVDGKTGSNSSLPGTLPTGLQKMVLVFDEVLGRAEVYLAGSSGVVGSFTEATSYSAARSGEISRSLVTRTKDVINVGDFAPGGVYPWNINDDTPGINAAIAEAIARVNAGASATLWFPAKAGVAGYRVFSKLTNCPGSVNVIMDVPIIVHFDQATINNFVWTIGDPAYRNYEVELKLWMATYGPATDYTVNPNFGAFQLINLNRSKVTCHQIGTFQICLQLLSTGAGQYTTGNVVNLGYIDGRWMLDLVADGRTTPATASTGAWMISNTFNGGAFSHDADRGGVDHAAIRCRVLNGAQNMHDLRFINPDIEIGHSGVRGDAFRCDSDATTATDNGGTGGGASIYIENAYLESNGTLAYSNPTNHAYAYIYGTANRSNWDGDLVLDEWGPMGSCVELNGMEQGKIPRDPRNTPARIWWSPAYSVMTKQAADAYGFRRVSAVSDVIGVLAPLIETGTTGPIWAGDPRNNARSGLWFNGTTNWLKTSTQTLATTLGNINNWRCRVDFIAYKASANGDSIITGAVSGGIYHWQIGVYTTGGGEPRIYAQVHDATAYRVIEVGIFIGVRTVAEFYYNGTSIYLRVNGFVSDPVTAGAVSVTNQVMQVGNDGTAFFFKGEIYDIVFF